MNIFHLSESPTQSAKWLVDKHVVKQCLESAQMLCTVYHSQNIDAPYKKTHQNHPSTIWTKTSYENFQWLIEHAYSISDEYTARYGKIHRSKDVLDWCSANKHKLHFDARHLTKFAIAISNDSICRTMPDFDENDPISCYRAYYKHDKKHIHQWKLNKPSWIDKN